MMAKNTNYNIPKHFFDAADKLREAGKFNVGTPAYGSKKKRTK